MSFVKDALIEDLGRGDLFQRCFRDFLASAIVIAKEDGIFSGAKYVKKLCKLQNIDLKLNKSDAEPFEKDQVLAELSGSFCEILKIERVFLNILQHSSGIATNTNKFVKALNNNKIALLDTRKTRPLLRNFEKYSVLNGGARNHRFGLDDCLMLKDTHLKHIKDLKSFVTKARLRIPFSAQIEVECESVEMAQNALDAGVDIIMCDNMQIPSIKKVLDLRTKLAPHVKIEASGNITLENIKDFALLDLDAISSGALIHKAVFIDLSMKMR